MLNSKCKHDKYILNIDKLLMTCINCNHVINLPQVSYDLSKITKSIKPTEYDKKIYTVTDNNDGTYLYVKKELNRE